MMRQAVGMGVERGVAQRALLEHHRDRVRRARRPAPQTAPAASAPPSAAVSAHRQRLHRRTHAPAASATVRGVVPAAQDGVALGRAQDRKPAERAAGVRHHALQQPHQPLAQRRSRRRVEQVGPLVEPQLAAPRPAARSAPAGNASRRGPRPRPSRSPLACAGKAGAVDRIVLEHQQRVEQLAQARRLLDLGKPDMLVRHQPRLAAPGSAAAAPTAAAAAAAASAAAAC